MQSTATNPSHYSTLANPGGLGQLHVFSGAAAYANIPDSIALKAGFEKSPLTLAIPGSKHLGIEIVALIERIRNGDTGAENVIAPDSLAGAWGAARRTVWTPVPPAAGAERLRRVWLPEKLVRAGRLVLINSMTGEKAADRSPVIGAWQRFAHPRQRTGSALSGSDHELAVEIAAVIRPTWVVVATAWKGIPVSLAASDQITGELAARAILMAEEDERGPWEHPMVQRATEIVAGVRTPAEISVTLHKGDSESGEGFEAFLAERLGRIGVRLNL